MQSSIINHVAKGSYFVEKVLKLERHYSGLNTNFYKALNMILDSIVQNNIPPSDVENLVLAVFSAPKYFDVGGRDAKDDNKNSITFLSDIKKTKRKQKNI